MEIIGFAWTSYGSSLEGKWHDYLWYIPTAINSLRGIGVFLILVVLPKDSRYYLFELICSLWERCGGRPLSNIVPSTRRSSTSTNTTATTTATATPLSPGDKERISLSSSDTQLSSHTASMSELHELPRQMEKGQLVISKSDSRSNILSKQEEMYTSNSRRSFSDTQTSSEISQTKTDVVKDKHLISRSVDKINESYPRKQFDGFPIKPPRKSIDMPARPYQSTENLLKNTENESEKINPSYIIQNPSSSSSPASKSSTSQVSVLSQRAAAMQNDTSDSEEDSIPPTPPTSPPPELDSSNRVEITEQFYPTGQVRNSDDSVTDDVALKSKSFGKEDDKTDEEDTPYKSGTCPDHMLPARKENAYSEDDVCLQQSDYRDSASLQEERNAPLRISSDATQEDDNNILVEVDPKTSDRLSVDNDKYSSKDSLDDRSLKDSLEDDELLVEHNSDEVTDACLPDKGRGFLDDENISDLLPNENNADNCHKAVHEVQSDDAVVDVELSPDVKKESESE